MGPSDRARVSERPTSLRSTTHGPQSHAVPRLSSSSPVALGAIRSAPLTTGRLVPAPHLATRPRPRKPALREPARHDPRMLAWTENLSAPRHASEGTTDDVALVRSDARDYFMLALQSVNRINCAAWDCDQQCSCISGTQVGERGSVGGCFGRSEHKCRPSHLFRCRHRFRQAGPRADRAS